MKICHTLYIYIYIYILCRLNSHLQVERFEVLGIVQTCIYGDWKYEKSRTFVKIFLKDIGDIMSKYRSFCMVIFKMSLSHSNAASPLECLSNLVLSTCHLWIGMPFKMIAIISLLHILLLTSSSITNYSVPQKLLDHGSHEMQKKKDYHYFS